MPVSGTSFATKAGFVLDPDDEIVVQAATAHEAQRAIRGLQAAGFLDLHGYVLGAGPERIEPVDLEPISTRCSQDGAELIDVRERDERDDGYIAGSRNIPYRLLALSGAEIPTDRPVVTICESGARAGIAASILAAQGVDARPVLEGGLTGWAARGGAHGRVPPLRRLVTAPRLVELALFTADVDRLTSFYERVLGLDPAERSPGQAVFVLGELVLRIHATVEPRPAIRRPTTTSPSHSRAWTPTPLRSPPPGSTSTVRATSRGAALPTRATRTAASSSSRRRNGKDALCF